MIFVKKGQKTRYSFADDRCIGRYCWAPGMFQHRSPTSSGSRNTGSPDSACCLNRAYRGCPPGPDGERKEHDSVFGEITVMGQPLYQIELAKKRKDEGWKVA